MKKVLGCLLFCLFLACESEEDKAGRFFLMGNEALEEGKLKEAIRLYTESIDKFPGAKEVWNNRGVAYYKDRQYTRAINDYTHAIKQVDAYYFEAWRNRADAHYDARMYGQAMKDLNFLTEAFPDSAWVHFKFGLNLVAIKDYRKAVNAFRKSLDTDSSNVDALVNIANAFYLYGEQRGGAYFNQAEDYLMKAEAIDPNQPEIYNTRALMNIHTKEYAQALIEVNKALALEVNNPYFNNNRGYIYLMTNDLEQAERDINLSIKADPQNGWAYRNKGIFYFMNDNVEAAERNFKQAANYDETIPELNYYWGLVLMKLERKDEACAKLRKSIDAFENEGRGLFEKSCGTI